MVMSLSFKVDGLRPLLNTFQQLPGECRTAVLIPAAKRASRTMVRSIARYTPFNKRMRKTAKPHMRDSLTSVVEDYSKTQTVVAVVGNESGQAPHAHLVEEGTKPRWTNHKTQYRRMAVRARQIIKKGKVRWVTEKQKKSIGSFIKDKRKPTWYRGRMPAYHPVARGIKACEATVGQQLKKDIESGLTRELTQFKIARGT